MIARVRILVTAAALLVILLAAPEIAYAGYCTGLLDCFQRYWWIFLLALIALVAVAAVAAWAAEAAAIEAAAALDEEGMAALEAAIEAGDVDAVESAVFGTGGAGWMAGAGPAIVATGAAAAGAAGVAAAGAAGAGGGAEPPGPPQPEPPRLEPPEPPQPEPPQPEPPQPEPPQPEPPQPEPPPVPEGFTPLEWERFRLRREGERYPQASAENQAANKRYKERFPTDEQDLEKYGESFGTVTRSADGSTLTIRRFWQSPTHDTVGPTETNVPVAQAGDQGLKPGETAPFAWTEPTR